MIRLFLYSLISAFTIVGGVIGAGFITGKEIFVFFSQDFSLSGLYLTFVLFTLSIYLVMTFQFDKISSKAIGVFISIANIFIAGCMCSAISAVYSRLFFGLKNVEIFTIFTAILVFLVSTGGMGAIGKFNLFLIPLVIVVIVALGLKSTACVFVNLTPKTFSGVINPIIYVAFNVVLSFTVIKNSGEKLSPPFKMLCSCVTALVLSLSIFVISLAIKNSSKSQVMPFTELFIKDVKLSIIVDIITLFAILTTYVSALYTSYDFGGCKLNLGVKTLIFLFSISISNLGFSKIVDTVYPIIGTVGFTLLLVICLLSKIFQVKRPKRTSLPLKCKV
ncbi:MAG: hypothetical protein IJW64_02495 [Clostridia bacterium]|nr:hypothetical protein [Clostridia bacterium]